MPDLMTAAELKSWIEQKREFVLVDTSLAEDFAVEHIPGAQNACVFEVSFLDHVKALKGIAPGMLARVTGAGANTAEPVIVYGTSARSQASAVAAAKLEAAGYSHVHDLRGGLVEWRSDGNSTEVDSSKRLLVQKLPDGVHPVDVNESVVEWAGRNLASKHNGKLALKWGEVETRDGVPIGAQFVLDMTSISVSDLANPMTRAMLVKHLSSDDFFDVGTYPEAKFVLTTIEPVAEPVLSLPNYNVRGKLRLKGREESVDFPATVGSSDDGSLVAVGHFDIDRTRWGVVYGSGRFFEQLGKHLVSDLISLDLKIVAKKKLS
jgi:rhodanese-related sulfurtransferase/polyisoprenoid-binding protein YceI